MGQIIGSAAKPKRCNLQSLSSLGTPAAGEYILVSSDNSMNAAGQGNFDCYIVGDGSTTATALKLKSLVDDGAFDISAYRATGNVLAKYVDLSAALDGGSNIPKAFRKGGMSVKFVQSSDNKYVQYRLIADEFTTDTTQWAIADESVYVEYPEFVYVKIDANDKILWAIKADGSIYYGAGVPQQVIDYVQQKISELSLDEYEDIVTFLGTLITEDKTLATLLSEKVDKEENKGLIPTQYIEEIDNPDWIRVLVDDKGRILCGIKADGSIEWAVGVPTPVKEYVGGLLEGKVDKEEGKSLIDEDFVDNIGYRDIADNYIKAETDSDERVLFGIKKNGMCCFHVGIESPTLDTMNERIDTAIENAGGRLPNHKLVAAHNAPDSVKEIADYVCDGENDEVQINAALRAGGPNAVVTLTSGDFYLDEFKQRYNLSLNPKYSALALPYFTSQTSATGRSFNITLQGQGCRGAERTMIHIRERAWANVPEGEQPVAIGYWPIPGYNTFNANNFAVRIDDNNGNMNNQKKIVCIDCSNLGGGDIHHITMYAAPNQAQDPNAGGRYPVEGCVGFRSWRGSDTGTIHITTNVYACGFYEAFQLGAEHHILMNCGGRFNYYCFTFGNYDYYAGVNEHPITLINCADEGSQAYPLFVRNGYYTDDPSRRPEHPLQSVTFISFNLESSTLMAGVPKIYAQEYHDNDIDYRGDWCGIVEYTDGGWDGNKVNARFWADDGSGKNFTTRNLAHAPAGTTALRNTYLPNYMQHYFDTDKNKELIYDGIQWLDVMGNQVDNN